MNDEGTKVFEQATEYIIDACDDPEDDAWRIWHVSVEWRGPGDRWAVCVPGGRVLSRTGREIWEPQPSSRTDYFKSRTRFPLEEALEKGRNHVKTMKRLRGLTYAQWRKKQEQGAAS